MEGDCPTTGRAEAALNGTLRGQGHAPHSSGPPAVSYLVSPPPFQTLLDQHGRTVHRLLVALVGPTDADDCYQETWIAALRAYPRLRSADNLRAWVLTIARHKAIDALRARGRTVLAAALPEVPVYDEPLLADGGPLAAVRALPDKQREAVTLRHLLDADYATIAATMGTSQAAARRNVHEGLKKLREECRDA